jgi:hypothetical protein
MLQTWRKGVIGHSKSGKVFGRENNWVDEGINRKIIICYGRRGLSERSLINDSSDQPVSSGNKCRGLFNANRTDLDPAA